MTRLGVKKTLNAAAGSRRMSFHSQRGRINLCSSDDIPIGSTTGEILTASAPASPIKALYPSKASVQVKAPFKSNNKNIEKIKFESLIQDFAGFTSARGYSSWKTNLIDQGYTSSQIRDIVYKGSLLHGDNLWKGDWKKYSEEISGIT